MLVVFKNVFGLEKIIVTKHLGNHSGVCCSSREFSLFSLCSNIYFEEQNYFERFIKENFKSGIYKPE